MRPAPGMSLTAYALHVLGTWLPSTVSIDVQPLCLPLFLMAAAMAFVVVRSRFFPHGPSGG